MTQDEEDSIEMNRLMYRHKARVSGRIFLALCYFILLSFPNYDW